MIVQRRGVLQEPIIEVAYFGSGVAEGVGGQDHGLGTGGNEKEDVDEKLPRKFIYIVKERSVLSLRYFSIGPMCSF